MKNGKRKNELIVHENMTTCKGRGPEKKKIQKHANQFIYKAEEIIKAKQDISSSSETIVQQ